MRSIRLTAALCLTAGIAAVVCPAYAEDIGIASCDSFLKTYETCVASKAPEGQRALVATTLEKTRANWKEVAKTAEGKVQLDATCKETTEKVKKEVAALNCAW